MADNNLTTITFVERLLALLLVAAALCRAAFAPTQWPSSVILFYLGIRLVLFGMLTVGV